MLAFFFTFLGLRSPSWEGLRGGGAVIVAAAVGDGEGGGCGEVE